MTPSTARSPFTRRALFQHLLQPLLEALERRWQGQYGASLERVLFHSAAQQLGSRIYFNNRQQAGRPLLLVNLDRTVSRPASG